MQETVLVPIGKADPEGGVLVTLTPGQLSVAPTTKFTTAVALPESVGTVMFAGQVIVGACLSSTTTKKAQELVLPAASVATQLTILVPFGNTAPDGGLQTKLTPGLLSVAVAM